MFHWRDEGEPVRQGLNVYPLRSPYHLGGYLQIWRLRLYLRWSKVSKRLFRRVEWCKPETVRLPRNQWTAK